MNTSGGLEDGVCRREGRLNQLVVGTQLRGLEARGSQAAPPWRERPPREGDPNGMGPPWDGRGTRSHWVGEEHGARLEATGPVTETLGLCT